MLCIYIYTYIHTFEVQHTYIAMSGSAESSGSPTKFPCCIFQSSILSFQPPSFLSSHLALPAFQFMDFISRIIDSRLVICMYICMYVYQALRLDMDAHVCVRKNPTFDLH